MNGGVEKPYPPNEGFSLSASDQEQTGDSGPECCGDRAVRPSGFYGTAIPPLVRKAD
jgi:hypothetical protein